jgi:uncharacterized protein
VTGQQVARHGIGPVLLRGVDRAAFCVALAVRLRAGGVRVGATAVEDFVRALAVAPPVTRRALYWTARVTLVRRHTDLAVFDAVFAAVFDDAVRRLDPHARQIRPAPLAGAGEHLEPVFGSSRDEAIESGLPWATLPSVVGPADDGDPAIEVPLRRPSGLAGLADVPFEQLSESELSQLGVWLQRAVRSWPTRRSRREVVQRRGHRVALRPTLTRSRRTGWEPIELVRVRQLDRPRQVVMLCDVSQSMQAQARAYLHLMRALAVTTGAEVFAFAATLTRLTTALTHRSPQLAIELATSKVTDRFGGTRIATSLRSLLSGHHAGAVRGAIVLIASDGWDSDDPGQLAIQMARLRRRAYRVIWINPRAAAPGFEPRVLSMAAALPYCDRLVPGDNFSSLARVVAELGRAVSSTVSRGSTAGIDPR